MASTVTVDFNANLTRFTSSIDKATNDLNKFQSNTARIAGNIKTAFGVLGAGFAVAGIANAIRDVADFADEMGKAAQKVGTTAEALSGLKYAGDLADVSFEQLQTGLAKLAKTAEDFRNESKTAVDAFAKIGIDPTQFNDTTDLFAAVADKLSKMDNGARKTAIAMELLGRSGAQMIPLLNAGADGLKDAAAEAEKFGIIVTNEAAKAAEEFNDNMTRLGKAVDGLKISLGSGVIGDIADLTTQLLDAAQAADGFWGALIGVNTDKDSLASDLAETESRLRDLKKLRDEIDPGKSFANKVNDAIFGDVATINAQIKVAQQEYNTLLKMKEAMDKRLNTKPVVPGATPSSNPADKPKTPRQSVDRDAEAAKRFVEQLTKEAATLGLAGTALKAYEAEHLKLTPAQRAVIADSLKKIDAFEEEKIRLEKLSEAYEEHNKQIDDFNQRETDAIEEQGAFDADSVKSLSDFVDGLERARDPSIELLDNIGKIQSAVSLGIISDVQGEEYIAFLEEAAKKTEETTDEITEFWREAARNIQDGMSDFLFDAMQGELSDLAGSFKRTIDRMVADVLAAKAATALFGDDFGKGGDLGGIAGDIFGGIGDFFGGLFNANGNAFNQSGVMAFANGGVVSSATPFSFGGGKLGVMGEAGPEAILPLKRGPNGQLGVQAGGGAPTVFNYYIQTPDANSFRKSQPQIMAEAQRGLNRGRRVT